MRNRSRNNRSDWRDDDSRNRDDNYQMGQASGRGGEPPREDDYGQGDRDPNFYGSEYQGGESFGPGNSQYGSNRGGGEQFGGQRSTRGGRGGGFSDYGSEGESSRYGRRSPDYDEDRYWSSDRDRDFNSSGAGYSQSSGGYGNASGRYGARGYGDQRSGVGQYGSRQNQHDDDYTHWRNEQVSKFDKDYSDYQTERRKKFSEEFDKWRSSRPTSSSEGGSTGKTKQS